MLKCFSCCCPTRSVATPTDPQPRHSVSSGRIPSIAGSAFSQTQASLQSSQAGPITLTPVDKRKSSVVVTDTVASPLLSKELSEWCRAKREMEPEGRSRKKSAWLLGEDVDNIPGMVMTPIGGKDVALPFPQYSSSSSSVLSDHSFDDRTYMSSNGSLQSLDYSTTQTASSLINSLSTTILGETP